MPYYPCAGIVIARYIQYEQGWYEQQCIGGTVLYGLILTDLQLLSAGRVSAISPSPASRECARDSVRGFGLCSLSHCRPRKWSDTSQTVHPQHSAGANACNAMTFVTAFVTSFR